ncbi:MAG: protein kinase family protein [Verrucomicrobia bacterium]|nr:protein kinase family protein [Verrucomicrobiota bacterium]
MAFSSSSSFSSFSNGSSMSQVFGFKSDKDVNSYEIASQWRQIRKNLEARPVVKKALKQAVETKSPIRISKKALGSSHAITAAPNGHLYLHLKEELGKGAAKTVTKVIDLSSGKLFAKKSCICPDEETKTGLLREYRMASWLPFGTTSMPVSLSLRENKSETKLIYFEEIMEYGDLKKGNHLITPTNLMHCAKQMVTLVARFHQSRILHRDIKPENFFIKSVSHGVPDLLLGDLGEAVDFSETERKESYAGTDTTWSPEYCRAVLSKSKEEISKATTIKGDSWQLGMTMLIGFKDY